MKHLILIIGIILTGCATTYPPYKNLSNIKFGMTIEQVDKALANVRPSRLWYAETNTDTHKVYYQYLSDPNNYMNEQIYFFVFDKNNKLIRWESRENIFPKHKNLDSWLKEAL